MISIRLGRVPLVRRPSLGYGPVILTSDTFDQATGAQAAAVDFWSPKCGPCIQFKPIFEEVAADPNNPVFMATVNADENKSILDEYGVEEIPTTIYFQNGVEVDRTKGKLEKDALVAKLNSLFAAATPAAQTPPGAQNGPVTTPPVQVGPGSPAMSPNTILGLVAAGAATVLAIFLLSR